MLHRTVRRLSCILAGAAWVWAGGVAAAGDVPSSFVSSTDSELSITPDFSQPVFLADAPDPDAGGGSNEELAKKLSNPVASLISVPLQFNYDTGFGPKDAGRYTLNVQPVIPFSLGDDFNLIVRTIMPVIYQESLADGVNSQLGMGDVTQSFFFSPKQPVGGWIVGVGPVFLWPTATDDSLGGEKWGAGPTGLVLRQQGPWTYGVLANHIWSYAGDTGRDNVNATFIQPFLAYTTKTAFTLTLNAESTYDWNAGELTLPINLMGSQLLKVGKLPVSIGGGFRYYAESPDGGPEWGVRVVLTFLFPT